MTDDRFSRQGLSLLPGPWLAAVLKTRQGAFLTMLLIVLLMGSTSLAWGEIVQAGGGLGWDGAGYAAMVRDLPAMIAEGRLGTYYAQRVAPAAVVRAGLIAAGAEPTNATIISGFAAYNLVLMLIGVWLWKLTADRVDLGLQGRWIGFAGLFVNFQAAKQSFFYPVLTDVTALVASMAMLYFFIARRPWPLLAVSVVGAFSWPVIAVSGAALLLLADLRFPPEGPVEQPVQRGFRGWLSGPRLVLAAAACSTVLILALSPLLASGAHACPALRTLSTEVAGSMPMSPDGRFSALLSRYDVCLAARQGLTAAPAVAGLMWLVTTLMRPSRAFPALIKQIRKIRPRSLVLALMALGAPALGVRLIANPTVANPSSLFALVRAALFPAEGKLFMPLVSLIAFWGVCVLLALLHWRAFGRTIRTLGPGFAAAIVLAMLLGLVGEPRFLTTGWPFIVLGVAITLDHVRAPRSFLTVFVAGTLLLAQFWLPINIRSWPGGDFDDLLLFPRQLYFMHYGLWMGWPGYVGQAVAFAAISALLWWTWRPADDARRRLNC